MTRRLFWRCAYPVARLAHLFGASYKWVNVGRAAWHRESFDPLWHHEWFGDPIAALPDQVALCGVAYNVAVAEGTVVFTTAYPFMGYPKRLVFERRTYLWYADVCSGIPVVHVLQAYQWIAAVYGGSHVIRAEPETVYQWGGPRS